MQSRTSFPSHRPRRPRRLACVRPLATVAVLGIAIALIPSCSSGSGETASQVEPPSIEVVFPDRGAPTGGERVSIYTTGFAADFEKEPPAVHFGNRRAKVTPTSSFSLEVEVPPGAEGPVDIRILDGAAAQQAVLASGFSYDPSDPLFDTAGLATLEGAPALPADAE